MLPCTNTQIYIHKYIFTHIYIHTQGELLIVAGEEVDREAAQVLIDSAGRGVVTFDILAADGGSPSLTGTAEVLSLFLLSSLLSLSHSLSFVFILYFIGDSLHSRC